MGNSRSLDLKSNTQATSKVWQGEFQRIITTIDDYNPVTQNRFWKPVVIEICQSNLVVLSQGVREQEVVINKEFFVLGDDPVNKEIVVSFYDDLATPIWRLRAGNTLDFVQLKHLLVVNRRPGIMRGRSCELCGKKYGVLRRQKSCKYCGISVCKKCTTKAKLRSLGYYSYQLICNPCASQLMNLGKSLMFSVIDRHRNQSRQLMKKSTLDFVQNEEEQADIRATPISFLGSISFIS